MALPTTNELGSKLEQVSFHTKASRVLNQTQHQEIQGGQHIYIRECSPHATVTARPSRCVFVPFATVPTFTKRPHLSNELNEKIRKAYGTELAHAAAVIGLGGTGKTQLVLRYIEEREEEYDAVLWIDVRNEETTRASFDRCCRELGLYVEAALGERPVQDAPSVQAVLSWLRNRDEGKRWLVVLDNADDLSWHVSGIVPKGKAGTVIVTSQDAQVSRLLGGSMPMVRVDAMEPEEAVRLMSSYFDKPSCHGDSCLTLFEEITEYLDRLALAMDLAGAWVRADVDNGIDLEVALRQYIADYRHNRDRLLRDEEFARTSPYKKTVWTVWETSLASLNKLEDNQSEICANQLLGFLTLLDKSNAQEELFRLASLGLQKSCDQLGTSVPGWMQGLLRKGKDNKWNDLCYRTTVRALQRYGLVRPVGGPWKGLTMHSLVRWRAGAGINLQEYWRHYLIFLGAVCVQIMEEADKTHFRQHLVVHFPLNSELFRLMPDFDSEKSLRWICEILGWVWQREGRFEEAGQLQSEMLDVRRRLLGGEHPDTLNAMADLGSTYSQQGLWGRAKDLESQVIEKGKKILGEEHPETLRAMHHFAITLSNEGQWDDAVKLNKAVATNLAVTYSKQGRWKEAEELQVKVLEASRKAFGEEYWSTLGAIGNLALTYSKQGRWKEAEELQVKVLEASRRVLSKEHPDTLRAIRNLAITYSKQGRWMEAEELQVKVIETSRKVLGQEHPATLGVMGDLAITYWIQGRLEEAKSLQTKVVVASRRVLGKEYAGTIKGEAGNASLGVAGHDLGNETQDKMIY
ncbi:hypothetical protein KC343_g2333 [Hortaea werneckii]|nr:hypothetical protein KC317_g3595 [Hortaea werneckii]KAI7634542.1 hypothetical protein KC343_g2333 [Hortaea werneckii]KAI7681420.1 hypothetical protein KC319_g1601 [Hortaea werneckii]KAI7718749.1 hypothetical protein KC322_g2150 [Hortaea werneckii]